MNTSELDKERAAVAQLETAASMLAAMEDDAGLTLHELQRNHETLNRIQQGVREVDAELSQGIRTTKRMQRRTGFTGIFVQIYEAITGSK